MKSLVITDSVREFMKSLVITDSVREFMKSLVITDSVREFMKSLIVFVGISRKPYGLHIHLASKMHAAK